MSLKHGLLGLLNCEGSMTGYDLDKFFKNSLAYFWQAKTSQIYRELNSMEELGWLNSERVVQEEKPNKKVYSITAAGKDELHKWLTAPSLGLDSGIKSTFLMRIFFSGEICKEQTINLLKDYKEMCIASTNHLAEVLKLIDKESAEYPKHATYWKLTALHGEISSKAGAEWADKAIGLLEDMEDNV